MKNIKLAAIALLCSLTLIGCTYQTPDKETEKEDYNYAQMDYIEVSETETQSSISIYDDIDISLYVDIPSYSKITLSEDIDFEYLEDMTIQKGDEITIIISYEVNEYTFETEQDVIIGEYQISTDFDDHLIGLSPGETTEFTINISDSEVAVFKNHEGEEMQLTVKISETEKEEKKEEVLEQLWEDFVNSSTVYSIYTEYEEYFSNSSEKADEAMIAAAAAQKEGIDENSSEFEEELLADFTTYSVEDIEGNYAIITSIYKDIISQKIFDALKG